MRRGKRNWRLAAAAAALVGLVTSTAATAGLKSGWGSGLPVVPDVTGVYDPAGIRHGAPIRGMIFYDLAKPNQDVISQLGRLHALGVNTISLYIKVIVNDPRNVTSIAPGVNTPPDAALSLIANAAHEQGMDIEFMPILWNTGKYIWRGQYKVGDPVKFWASYRAMITHYADLAESLGVEILAIGSELRTLYTKAAQWRAIAADVKGRYHGLTTYMAEGGAWGLLRWWKAVDLISVSPYYALTDYARPNPPVASLVSAWQPYLRNLRELSAKWHRRVLFDEIGYTSMVGTAIDPAWHHNETGKWPASETAQANAYEALFRATKSADWLAGTVWFSWWLESNAPALDKTYTPRDKLAECVIARHWAPSKSAAVQAVGKLATACAAARMI